MGAGMAREQAGDRRDQKRDSHIIRMLDLEAHYGRLLRQDNLDSGVFDPAWCEREFVPRIRGVAIRHLDT